MTDGDARKQDLTSRAYELGLSALGVARVSDLDEDATWPAAERLRAFIAAGRHGQMDWMETHQERRAHPQALWAEAKSAVVFGLNYGPDTDPLAGLAQRDRGVISVYARGKDYHDVFKKRLKQLARWWSEETGHDVKVFVDTAPLMEKPLAARAGVGWQGKHTNLVSRTYGSWLFLGAMLTTADLDPDPPEIDHCGSCRACLDVCPTDAFPAPYQLDARRCLAYLSIEHKGPIPIEFREPMGNRIFGCDDCLAVCPWNKFAQVTAETAFGPREGTDLPLLADLLTLNEVTFRQRFAGTPVKRTGRDRFLRNVLIAAGNAQNAAIAHDVAQLLDDASPLVRGAAVWAMSKLVSREAFAALAEARRGREADDAVLDEWDTGRT